MPGYRGIPSYSFVSPRAVKSAEIGIGVRRGGGGSSPS
eukprot:CAMPEP_0119425392 /NCGR_PEP_ID=MMETSP1335-20130426/34429_1 /TAXON_ID=259385 /ORGANISM="Chrysoculter rhomboideus, Strain RCC1486" /LENGTH=37 /DNA_ID= /DNA_START= /DNA_END= /DNA_ORIENTATION=